MLIGIDANEANVRYRVGSNTYAYHILKHLHSLDHKARYRVYLKTNQLEDLPEPGPRWRYRSFGPKPLWTQWRLPLDLYTHKPAPDLFFTPGHYAPRFCPVPSVITILDTAFLYYPDSFKPSVHAQLSNWTRYSVNHAAHIFTISKNSKSDIIKHYSYPQENITVTYPGTSVSRPASWSKSDKQAIKKKYSIPNRYFIFVGTRQPRKNLKNLVKAFLKLHASERDVNLVIVGKVWSQFRDIDIPSSNSIITTGYVPDQDLISLILASEALVFPSLYEGFGLPVLEAMKLGVPVVASATSSIPEIIGTSPLLFNPQNPRAIASTLKRSLTLPEATRKKLVREGKIRANLFTWEKCAKITMEVLHALAV